MLSRFPIDDLGPKQALPEQSAHSENAIEVQNVSKRYRRYAYRNLTLKGRVLDRLRGRGDQFVEFDVLKDVTFSVPHGQALVIVGRNGAGKSTLLRILARVAEPDSGVVRVNGRVSPLLELGAGFAHELTGRRNIYLYGALLGLRRHEITQQLESIVNFSEIGEFLDTPVKHYSSGMYLRLAFAVAAHTDPDILLLDEILAVGDVGFQAKCLERIDQFRLLQKTIILVTHNLPSVQRYCDRALLVHDGKILEDGSPEVVMRAYQRVLTT
jgi:ABC-type polysaccharide/polyol phosphate transport system ATPase subunit